MSELSGYSVYTPMESKKFKDELYIWKYIKFSYNLTHKVQNNWINSLDNT